MKSEIICDCCNKKFLKENKHINLNRKRNRKNYCSIKCRCFAKRNGKYLKCKTCNKKIWKQKSEISKNKSGNFFCNRSCSTKYNNGFKGGKQHWNWSGGNSIYRKRALKHYGKKCRICNYKIEKVLEIHHKDNNRQNNKLENLDVLCPTHHKEYQVGIRKY